MDRAVLAFHRKEVIRGSKHEKIYHCIWSFIFIIGCMWRISVWISIWSIYIVFPVFCVFGIAFVVSCIRAYVQKKKDLFMTEHQKEILYKKLYGEKIKEWKRDTVFVLTDLHAKTRQLPA